jgi:hypothetical protein
MAASAMTFGSVRVSAGAQGWNTTTQVMPGESLTIQVTQPGVNIATSSDVATCPVVGLGSSTVIYYCDRFGLGIGARTHLLQTWTDSSGNPLIGPFPETVTYNAQGIARLETKPTACQYPTLGLLYNTNWSCTVTLDEAQATGGQTVEAREVGEALRLFVLASDQSLVITHFVPSGPYGCDLDTLNVDREPTTPSLVEALNNEPTVYQAGSPPSISVAGVPPAADEPIDGQQWGSEIVVKWDCTGNEAIPGGTTIEFDGTATSAAAVEVAQFVDSLPAPTTEAVYGPPAPTITAIQPDSGPVGSTVTLVGMNLKGFAVTFGATPPGSPLPAIPPGGTTVTFGSSPASNVSCTDDGQSCTATVPGPVGASQVSVSTFGTSNSLPFTTTAASAPASAPASTSTPVATSAPVATSTSTPAPTGSPVATAGASSTATPTSSPAPSATPSSTPSGRR